MDPTPVVYFHREPEAADDVGADELARPPGAGCGC